MPVGGLEPGRVVGKLKVSECIRRVEQELATWECGRYFHITRALSEYPPGEVNLESIFSKPSQEHPVPVAVVCVYFALATESGSLTYRFEQDAVRHTVGRKSLVPHMYEAWLDRLLGDKLQVRELHDLATSLEESRLVPPPVVVDAGPAEALKAAEPEGDVDEQSTEDGQQSGPQVAVRSTACDYDYARSVTQIVLSDELPLSTLLSNIFDAADEEDEFELTHKEVAALLYATPLGLADWDIKLLLTTATELDSGKIEYKPFVEAAPDIIQALLKRRADFQRNTGSQALVVQQEAIELCYGEEIEEVARAAREAFAQADASGKGTLTRHEFRQGLLSRIERFSMMEVQMLMQMCKEDDYGLVPYEDFPALLQELRIDSLQNALVETDVGNLRVHLILLARRDAYFTGDMLSIWELRNLLLSADQLCLTRMQIHVILMILHPDEFGNVEFEYFLRVCCTVIPDMFDSEKFKVTADTIARERADALAKQELEELQGITNGFAGGRKPTRNDEDDQDDTQANLKPDCDAVEKALIHCCNAADEKVRQHPTLGVSRFVDAMNHESVQACQLSEAELRGLVAEAEVLPLLQEVAYVEHIKTWVPMLFELRRARVYDGILNRDWGYNAAGLIELWEYEVVFPLKTEHGLERPASASPARSSRGSPRKVSRGRIDQGGEGLQRKNSFRNPRSGPGTPGTSGGQARATRRSQSSIRSLQRSDSSMSQESVASRRSSTRPPSRGDTAIFGS